MLLLVAPTFARAAKKLHPVQKAELDVAVRAIAKTPLIGDAKAGDLATVRVYKFRMSNQLCLIAYTLLDETTIKLLAVGSHENFYRDMRRN